MPDSPSPDQVPPPPVGSQGVPARNRVLVAGAALGLIAVAVVLLTLPTGENGQKSDAPPPTQTPSVAPAASPPSVPPAAPTPAAAPPPAPPPPAPAPVTTTINASAVPRTAVMRLDGKVTTRRRLTVSPGPHILEVTESGYLLRTDSVQVAPGQQFTWTPKLVAAPPAKGAVAPPPPAEPVAKRGNVDESACRQSVTATAWHDAFPVCMRSAEAGSTIAQRNLALMFQHGEGTSRSDDNAAHWFAEAAHGGDAESMYQLAIAYDRGRGVRKDQAAALDWYTRAGNAGQADASYAVGDAFEKGHLGTAKDKAKAIEWYRKAAAQGNKDAANKVRDLSR